MVAGGFKEHSAVILAALAGSQHSRKVAIGQVRWNIEESEPRQLSTLYDSPL